MCPGREVYFNAVEDMTLKEALDAVGKTVLHMSSQVVCWSDFFGGVWAPIESISAYFTRYVQQTMDCGFQCPQCDCDISDYVLLHKLITGLCDCPKMGSVQKV